jgi:hypothetical protein
MNERKTAFHIPAMDKMSPPSATPRKEAAGNGWDQPRDYPSEKHGGVLLAFFAQRQAHFPKSGKRISSPSRDCVIARAATETQQDRYAAL